MDRHADVRISDLDIFTNQPIVHISLLETNDFFRRLDEQRCRDKKRLTTVAVDTEGTKTPSMISFAFYDEFNDKPRLCVAIVLAPNILSMNQCPHHDTMDVLTSSKYRTVHMDDKL